MYCWQRDSAGAAAALVCTEVLGLVFASWRLRRQCGYRNPVAFLLRLLGPVAVSMAAVVALSGQHVLIAGTGAVMAYLAANLVIGPVTPSKLSALGRGANDDA